MAAGHHTPEDERVPITASPQRRSSQMTARIMSAVRSRDSIAELAIRRRLWANGFRYRIRSKLPGKPDIVFPGKRVAIFVDGDLWHGNSWRVRGLPSLEAQFPTRTEWWVSKIRRTMARDLEVNEQLAAAGWTVQRFWESDVLADPNQVVRSIALIVFGKDATSVHDIQPSAPERRRLASVRVRSKRAHIDV